MLKIRLARLGRKKLPMYRIVVIEHSVRRNGRPVEYIGYYNPMTKDLFYDKEKFNKWKSYGAQPSEKVLSLCRD
jgi:small subunit ribosomal protein S16